MLSILPWSALFIVFAKAAPSRLGSINIDTDPAPPPDKGPAGSANADRNPANLKYAIVAIVGSYAVWTLLTIIVIVFVGRRLRRRAQKANQSLHLVRMKTFPFTDTSPISQGKSANFSISSPNMSTPRSPGKLHPPKNFSRKSHKSNPSEYSISTVNSFDEAQRAKNMDQLADLYAAVMAHDEEMDTRSKGMEFSPSPSDYYTPVTPQVAPELSHLYHSNQLPHPMAPTPVDTQFPEDVHENQASRSTNRTTKSTPLSIISELSTKASGLVSPKRPKHITIKNQRISQPMGSADLRDAYLYSDSTPLSPRLYSPGPPPPPPQSQNQPSHRQIHAVPESEQIRIHLQSQTSSQYPQSRDRRIPPALALRNTGAVISTIPADGSQTSIPSHAPKALPFREAYGDSSLRSAPPTKTTFLERPDKHYGPKSGLRTGTVPQTPYSPYMPFTPMTPITPRRLATREELKKQRKEERMKVLDECDLVSDEGWGA